MPVKTACPACLAPYTLADTMRGKKVRCKHCQEVFAVTDGAELAIQPEAAPPPRPAGSARVRGTAAPPPLASPDARTGPLRRRREPISADAPRSNALLWILLASGGGMLLIAGIVVTIILVARSASDEPGPVVQNPMRPGGPGPAIPNPMGQNPQPAQGQPPLKASSTRFQADPQDSYVKDILFAPQARQVGLYHWDAPDIARKLLTLYDVQTGQKLGVIDLGKSPSATYLDISPDGTRVAQQESIPFKGNPLTIWSAPDGKILFEKWDPYPRDPKQPGDFNRELVWFAFLDRDRLLTATRGGQYDLFDMTQKRVVYSVRAVPGQSRSLNYDGFSRRPTNIALSRDRKLLALTNRNGFDLIDTSTGKLLRSTARLDGRGKVGNEWGVAFSPDGSQLVAKLNLFEADRKQHEYVLLWDVATGQQKAMFAMAQDFNANGPLIWWGAKHLLVCNGIVTEGKVLSLTDGRFWRACERCGHGRLASTSPDGRLWCATSLLGIQRAEVSAVELPEDQLGPPPQGGAGQQLPRWYIRPDGVSTVRGGF
jgi:hypothetical protein